MSIELHWIEHPDAQTRARERDARVCAYAGLAPASQASLYARGEFGKPYLPNANVQLNWSDSGDVLLLALSRGIELGVDLERNRTIKNPTAMAKRILSDAELSAWMAVPKDQQHNLLLRHWVAKEAVCKCIGRGLAFGTKRIECASNPSTESSRKLDPTTVFEIFVDAQTSGIFLRWVKQSPDTIAALVYRASEGAAAHNIVIKRN